ncbi:MULTISPECIES: Arc family DNA-binding protein [Aeromonas]|uniref:Arc family DNA-binding protein n=1 Tax=Aeromonas TaxID=642 RepID=UPI001C221C41|nr:MULTISPECIES: Arc family DNA-binding protein [Aeromonas]MDX7805707.1 Arc family DNA-binding protein [Aeromonas caviae]QXB96115.1 Arc family DNA-binding protein [Aeromonas sp. FDAARGOS 1406]
MSKDIQKTALRLPRDLHSTIHEAAAAAGRTMNAEIVYRLQRTFDEDAEIADSGVKIIEGMSINRSAFTLPPGTVLTPHEIDKDDPRYTPYVRREEIQEVLDYIRQEMKNKKS